MRIEERPVVFQSGESALYGVLHLPEPCEGCGVLVVVGGPQTRVGSHRQFVLLARHLAENGIPVMRFDYAGMGDSEGERQTYDDIGADVRRAVDQFFLQQPGMPGVVIWGLCDAASAACFYARLDARITGLVLVNPWVHSEAGQARAYLKHYYLQRLLRPDFWQKLGRGEYRPLASLRSFVDNLKGARGAGAEDSTSPTATLPGRMLHGLQAYGGRVLIILSGNDLVAAEFRDTLAASPDWQALLRQSRFTRRDLEDADHTFSRRRWRNQVADWTLAWLKP